MVLPEGGRPADASALAPQRVPFDARRQALARVWEAAADETFVDHPICPDCAAEVQRELELRLAELQQEAAAYEAAAQRLEALQAATGEAEGADGEAEAERRHAEQLAEARREVERERCAAPHMPGRLPLEPPRRPWNVLGRSRPHILLPGCREDLAGAEAELAVANARLAAAEEAASALDGAEAAYWEQANAFTLQLQDHLDERDAVRDGCAAAAACGCCCRRLRLTPPSASALELTAAMPGGRAAQAKRCRPRRNGSLLFSLLPAGSRVAALRWRAWRTPTSTMTSSASGLTGPSAPFLGCAWGARLALMWTGKRSTRPGGRRCCC